MFILKICMKHFFVIYIYISFLFFVCVLIVYTYTSDLVPIQLYYHLMYLIYMSNVV